MAETGIRMPPGGIRMTEGEIRMTASEFQMPSGRFRLPEFKKVMPDIFESYRWTKFHHRHDFLFDRRWPCEAR
jgi:hypothetical protein